MEYKKQQQLYSEEMLSITNKICCYPITYIQIFWIKLQIIIVTIIQSFDLHYLRTNPSLKLHMPLWGPSLASLGALEFHVDWFGKLMTKWMWQEAARWRAHRPAHGSPCSSYGCPWRPSVDERARMAVAVVNCHPKVLQHHLGPIRIRCLVPRNRIDHCNRHHRWGCLLMGAKDE